VVCDSTPASRVRRPEQVQGPPMKKTSSRPLKYREDKKQIGMNCRRRARNRAEVKLKAIGSITALVFEQAKILIFIKRAKKK